MDHLQTEGLNPASARLDELTPLQLVQLMNAEDARVIPAVACQAEKIARAIEIITERLQAGGRLIYVGAGTSGRLGVLDATECPPTFSAPPGQVVGVIAGGPPALTRAVERAEDQPDLAERDLQGIQLSSKDVVVGIATSGRTPYVLAAVTYAKRQGAFTIGLSCNLDSELDGAVDLAITPVVGPEVLSGSTRLKAGTATKLVLNMLSTGAMVRLGKTYGNLMVDLRATNSKLRARANRIVRILTKASVEEADQLLRECGGELKTALVVQLASVSVEEARARLQQAGGQVRKALDAACGLAPRESKPSPRHPTRASPSSLLLGIDGGGTRTVALLACPDAEQPAGWSLLGRGEAGPSNLRSVGATKALQALQDVVTAAFAAAGITPQPAAAACLGLAGAGREGDRALILDWARSTDLARHVDVTSDATLLLAAGTPEGWGLAVVAGTGSMALGQTAEGRTARAGGWGYLLGDEGSGYALALAGLQAVVRAADGRGRETQLTNLLLRELGLAQPADLVTALHGGRWDRAALARLAPLVLETAEAGDAVATGIAQGGAQQLAETAAAVARKLGFATQTPVPLACAGGVLLGSAFYRQRFLEALQTLRVRPAQVTLVREPAEGALRLAQRLLRLETR